MILDDFLNLFKPVSEEVIKKYTDLYYLINENLKLKSMTWIDLEGVIENNKGEGLILMHEILKSVDLVGTELFYTKKSPFKLNFNSNERNKNNMMYYILNDNKETPIYSEDYTDETKMKLGKPLFYKFSSKTLNDDLDFGQRQEGKTVKHGDVLDGYIDIPIHVDDSTKSDYEIVYENGSFHHTFN